jgi:hypothetical protein
MTVNTTNEVRSCIEDIPHQQEATLGLIFQTPKIPRQSKVPLGSRKKSQSDYPYEN